MRAEHFRCAASSRLEHCISVRSSEVGRQRNTAEGGEDTPPAARNASATGRAACGRRQRPDRVDHTASPATSRSAARSLSTGAAARCDSARRTITPLWSKWSPPPAFGYSTYSWNPPRLNDSRRAGSVNVKTGSRAPRQLSGVREPEPPTRHDSGRAIDARFSSARKKLSVKRCKPSAKGRASGTVDMAAFHAARRYVAEVGDVDAALEAVRQPKTAGFEFVSVERRGSIGAFRRGFARPLRDLRQRRQIARTCSGSIASTVRPLCPVSVRACSRLLMTASSVASRTA
jgi:hypothetical protein